MYICAIAPVSVPQADQRVFNQGTISRAPPPTCAIKKLSVLMYMVGDGHGLCWSLSRCNAWCSSCSASESFLASL